MRTKSQKNATLESWHPFCPTRFGGFRPSGVAAAASASAFGTRPTSAIRARTVLRRVRAASGLRVGSNAVGCWTIPASNAACGRVRSRAWVLKYRLAAASTPYELAPKNAMLR